MMVLAAARVYVAWTDAIGPGARGPTVRTTDRAGSRAAEAYHAEPAACTRDRARDHRPSKLSRGVAGSSPAWRANSGQKLAILIGHWAIPGDL